MIDYAVRRDRMVERDLIRRGITDAGVIAAMREVPREMFIPRMLRPMAYNDAPLPIGKGQTISQPYIVALMLAALDLGTGQSEKALDVGTGSGYAAAVLACLVEQVYTVERHGELARAAADRFDALGLLNIEVRHGDGTLGWPAHAPYDGIVVAAAGRDIPDALREQLATGGRLVVPVDLPRTASVQRLLRIVRLDASRFEEESLGEVRFVPLVSERKSSKG